MVSIIDTEISYGEEVLIETSIVGFAYGEDENVLGGMTNILCDYDTNTQNRETGVYDVTLDGHLTANNYHFRYVDGKLTVNKRELSAVFSSKSTEYTGLDQEITLTISNIAYKDIDVLISKINCQLDAEQIIGAKVDNNIVYTFVVHDAKAYDVVATIIEDDNYSLSPIEDKIVVNPAQLAVDKNSIASGELSFTGLLNEDVITENDYTIQLFSDKQYENEVILNNLETGIYYYVITLNNPTNYTISNGTGTLEVAS